ncbi:MAG: YbbR-like domain-containing protein [Vulcanimicrobiaceae bacterium]
MLDRLRHNLGLKLLALAFAVTAWAYLRLTPNPIIAARFVQQFSVPISTFGLGPDYVARYTDKEAVVAIDQPRGGAAIRPDAVRALLNLTGRSPGVYNVPVEVIAPKLEIKSLSPASVTLSVERIEERSLAVSLHYIGDSRKNVVVERVNVQPAYATLRAPSSDLDRVASVRVDVPLPSSPSTFDAMVRPVATDQQGAEVADVAVAPNLLRVRATFGPGERER